MKMIGKLLAFTAAVAVALSITACGSSSSSRSKRRSSSSKSSTDIDDPYIGNGDIADKDIGSNDIIGDGSSYAKAWLKDGYYIWKETIGNGYGTVNAQMEYKTKSNGECDYYSVYYYFDDGSEVCLKRPLTSGNGSRIGYTGFDVRFTDEGNIEFKLFKGVGPGGYSYEGSLTENGFTVATTFYYQGDGEYTAENGNELMYSQTPFYGD